MCLRLESRFAIAPSDCSTVPTLDLNSVKSFLNQTTVVHPSISALNLPFAELNHINFCTVLSTCMSSLQFTFSVPGRLLWFFHKPIPDSNLHSGNFINPTGFNIIARSGVFSGNTMNLLQPPGFIGTVSPHSPPVTLWPRVSMDRSLPHLKWICQQFCYTLWKHSLSACVHRVVLAPVGIQPSAYWIQPVHLVSLQ